MSRLKELRLSKNISKAQLAEQTEIPPTILTYLEKYGDNKYGRPMNMEYAETFAKYFNVTTDYVFGVQAIKHLSSFDDGLLNLYDKTGKKVTGYPFHNFLKEEALSAMDTHRDMMSPNSRYKYIRSLLLHEIVGLLLDERYLNSDLYRIAKHVFDELPPARYMDSFSPVDSSSKDNVRERPKYSLNENALKEDELLIEYERCLLLLNDARIESKDIVKANQLLKRILAEKDSAHGDEG